MGMTGKELLEKYKKRRQGNDVSSEETIKTTGTPLTGSQLLENYNRKKYGLSAETTETSTESPWDKYKEFANSEEGSQGWQKYLADTEASKQAEKKELEYDLNEDGKEAWWEKTLGWLSVVGNSADTTLPMHMTTQVTNDIRTVGLPDNSTPEADWNDEQRNIFGYLYSTSPDTASKYAEYLNTEAKEKEAIQKIQDSATDNFWAGVGHTAGAIATAPLGLADFLNDLVLSSAGVSNTQYDGTVSPFEYSQAVTGGISEHLNEKGGTLNENIPIIGGKGWGDVYGLGTSIAQSAVSGYTLGGIGTLVSYFGQGAASGVDDALSRGASEGQAVLYGTVLGVAEGLAEQIGIDNLFKLGASPTLKVAIKNKLKQAGAEGMEEGLTSIISNIADNAIMQDQSNFNAMVKAYMEQGMTEAKAKQKAWLDSIEGIAFDTLGGAISGGVHAGVHTGIKSGVANYNASKIYGDSVQDLLAEAADIGGEAATVADKYRAKYENKGKLSGAALNEIVYANEQEMRTQDKSKIKSAVEAKLTEYGETGDVSAIADILVKQASGEQLTSKETNILNSSKAGHIVSGELNRQNLKSGLLANDWARDIETDKINSDVYTRDLYNLAEQKVTNKEDASAEAERVIEPKFKVSESGKTTVEGNEVSIKEVASIKDGDITLRLENGETVNANDVEFSSSDEMLYATVVDMNLNAETANAFIRGFNATEGLSVDQYALGFREAYKYGSYGFPVQEMSRDGFSSALNESQKSLAYGLGKVDAKYAVEAKQNAVKNTKVTKEFHEDSMSIEEAETVEGLTDRQKTSIKAMRSLSNALGLNVRFFESKVNDKGKRVGENGRYDPSTGILYIDLYAGLKGEGTILFTAGHELTHFIRQWSPAKFKVFADVLLEKYGKKGVSVDALVREQIEKAKRKGRDISYDTAYEEVIADSCEAMLADGDAFATVSAKIKAKDKNLWKKIKEFFTDLVAKIKAAYTGLKPDSPEGQFVSDMLDTAEQLKALWTEALVEASENYAEAESIVSVDTTTESVSPMFSERTWTESDYVVHRDQMAKKIANALGITEQKAKSYIDDINSIARMIANDRVRLDYEASSFGSAFVSNVEYGGSFDYTTLCKKRRIYTGTFTEIQKRLKDTALSPDDILTIRNMLIEEGIEATCGLCYVEGSRANMGKFAKEFIRLYKRDNPLAWIPNMADVNTPDGVEQMRISHPEAYDQYVYFWNHYGKLKDSDPALFASQQKPKLYESRKEYKGEILEHFKGDTAVEKKNLFGGIRMQNFSDFEIVHLIDTMQVIMDMSTVGLAGQAYTKVPEFAKAFGNTGLKINLSLIAKGVDADGNLIFDDREGMPHETAFDLRNKYSENVGTIIVTFTDAQLLAAMADPRIDFIIPFHRSQWKKGQYGAMGLPKGTKDYTFMQNEKLIKQTYHEYRGKMVKDKASNYMPNEYWDFSKSGKENAEAYLKMCAENNKRPKFYKFLDYDGKGTYSLKEDGSTDGYWKLLIDFKMYDNDGVGSPQMAVTPTFNMDEAVTMLNEYKGGHASYPVAHSVVDKFVEQYEDKGEVKFSDRDSLGNELSKEQQEFFKDSQVRDKKGNLMVLYHGTTANFNIFKKGDVGFHFGTKGAARGRVGFGKNVTLKEVYLNITNPIVFDEDLGSWDADFRLTRELYDKGILTQAEAESVLFTDDRQYKRTTEAANKKLASVLLEKGYDGIEYSNTFETKKASTSYIVFNSNQAKEITNKNPTSNPDIRFSDRDNTPNEFNPDGKTLDEQLEDILHTAESYDGRYLYIGRFTPEFISMVSKHAAIKDLPVAMNYRDAYLSMESNEHGKYKGNGINYHNLGKKGLKSAIESFESPEQVLLSKTNGKVELILEGVDRKGNKLLSIVALNTVAKNGKKYIEAHIVTSIYGRRSIEKYINKAEQEGRLIYNKKEELTQVNPQVQYEGIINANSSVNSVAQNEKNVNSEFSDTKIHYSIREEAPPKKTVEGYKVFVVKNGKLYPPMVANPNAVDTPVGVWLNADVGTRAPDSKTGRPQVKAGGKGTQGGSGSLAFRPGWHLGETPLATQFDRLNPETGVKELFPENFVWALCDIAADHDYQEEAMSYGYTKNGKFQHSLAGLPKLPKDGYYKYRTNPNPDTVPWLITGAMKVKRLLSDAEVNEILVSKGLSPKQRVGGNKTLADLGLAEYEGMVYSDRDTDSVSNRTLLANALESVAQNDIEKTKLTQYKEKIALIESEQKKLEETRAKIKELSFAKGARDTEAIKKLQFDANQMANRINTYDKQLLSLESTKALKGVLEREKATLRKKMEQKNRESLANYREKAAKTQRELLTRYQESRKAAVEGRHKTEMRHKIKKVVSDLNKLLLNPTKEQHVPIGLQGVVADALDTINMDTMNAEERVKYYNDLIAQATTPEEKKRLTEKRDFFAYRDMNFKERITALKNAYAEFKESDDPLIRNAHNDAIAELIKNVADSVGNISLKDMSFGQLEAVYDMYKAVLATVRNANKMFKEGRQETVTENSEAVKVEVKEVGGHQDRVLKSTKFLKKFGWDMLKPVTAMKVIGSKTLAKLFDNVRAAEDTWAVDVNEAKEFYKAVSDKYGYDKWDFKAQHSFKDGSGEEFSISLEQMLSLYAYSKREQADEHLEFGGFIFDDAIEVTEKNKLGIPVKYEVNDANPHRLGQIQIMEIIGKLTQEQRAFVDEMQTYLSEVMGAKGNEVSLALYDIKLYKEKNYFPLKTARYFREFDPEKSGTPKIKNSGFSKKTVPQAGNPIVLSNFMDVWASHVNDMSMYHAFVLPLEDFMRVYNYSSTAGGYDSVQQYIKNAYGSQANQYIERLMDDLNGGARVDSSADPINKGISLFKKASVFASASVVVQQPSAIARALAYINPKYFGTSVGSALNLKKHKEVWAEVKKYAPVAVIKEMGYFDTGMGRSTVEWIKGNKTIKDKMDDALSKAPAKADELSWSYIWLAVKNEIKDTTDLTPGSEEFLNKVGERFTEIITNTQVYDSVLSRSGMMRSKDTGMKMATAFMAEPTTTVNMMVDGIIQGKRGNKKFLASTVGAISASIILNSILVALVYAARDDDEDETYTEKYVGSVTSELLDGFNPLTYIPFVKDAWSIAQGYDVERSDMSVVSNLWESIEGLFNENKSGWEKVTDATGAVSSLFGIPLKNIIRDAKGMYNLTETLLRGTPTTGTGLSEAIGDAFTSSIPLWDRLNDSDSTSARLYKAILKGDASRYRSQYKTEAAYETAVRNALRDNDSRIKEAAQARYEGDIAEYTRIAKEIIREGNFSQDIVVGAINAELNAIKRGETTEEVATEDKDEVTSIYSGSDINSAFDNGDYTLGKQIISELIETKVANGMEEKNAKSSLRSSMTSYWKPLYKQAYQSGNTTEMARIRQILYSSGLYGSANEVVKTTQSWLKS